MILHYPPQTPIWFGPLPTDRWPRQEFSWTAGLMRMLLPPVRTVPSQQIIDYHQEVLPNPTNPKQIDGLIRDLQPVQAILSFLAETIGVQLSGQQTIIDLCAGLGAITTPLAQYFQTIGLEIEREYVGAYGAYLQRLEAHANLNGLGAPTDGPVPITNRVEIVEGDIRNRGVTIQLLQERLQNKQADSLPAVVMNPHFGLIPQAFDIAQDLNPSVIIAVLPLDVIAEAHGQGSQSYRAEQKWRPGRDYLAEFRSQWRLRAVEPIMRGDGTAQTGTLLFTKKSMNTESASIS